MHRIADLIRSNLKLQVCAETGELPESTALLKLRA
jgi:hypothetical protein